MGEDQRKKQPGGKSQERQARLAAKLRENLGRRKAQSRDRAEKPAAEEDDGK